MVDTRLEKNHRMKMKRGRKGLYLTKDALWENAVHESGHAVIAAKLGVLNLRGKTKHGVGLSEDVVASA